MYITTDRAFPTRRMDQLLQYTDLSSDNLDRIIIKALYDSKTFFTVLEKNITELSKTIKFDLIVIDSVAGALRSEFEIDQMNRRVYSIHKLGVLLNSLARRLSIPIVVTNQVTALIDQKVNTFGRSNVVCCFGMSWANYVHTRIFIGKTGKIVESDQLNVTKRLKVETSVRIAEVDFSPMLPNYSFNFIVDNAGIRTITIHGK